jgi:hypothetical protein
VTSLLCHVTLKKCLSDACRCTCPERNRGYVLVYSLLLEISECVCTRGVRVKVQGSGLNFEEDVGNLVFDNCCSLSDDVMKEMG